MASEYSFNVMPSVSISRSRFKRKSQHKTSFNLGEIVPIYVDEVLPGDTRSIDMASIIRMSTPIAPIMDNIYCDFYAFFVPNRLTWVHWKEFIGENNSGAGIPKNNYIIPHLDGPASTAVISKGSIGDYFGLPVNVPIIKKVSALPFRAFALIYNRWFRNQNLIPPLPVDTSDNNYALLANNYTFACLNSGMLKASKLPDYFTKALPYAQKGAAVTIPIGTSAPVIANMDNAATSSTGSRFDLAGNYSLGTKTTSIFYGYPTGSAQAEVTRLSADLSQATAATINQLRYAFQLQKFLEKDALYGTRYWEILASHFGVTASDASLQDPEYLGGQRMRINIDQVLSTAGYDDTNQQEVGKTGANSVSGFKGSLFTKSFTEHGYLFIVAVARHDQTYMQGINRMWSRNSRYDFYWPVFANLGAQDLKLQEIYADGTSSDDIIFGYQEAWAEYRFKPSIATGMMRPTSGNLTYWTLTNNFGSAPTLGKEFIEQDRDNIQRALVTGSNGPDFIADFYFEDIAVRPMPMFSIPGLIDHH